MRSAISYTMTTKKNRRKRKTIRNCTHAKMRRFPFLKIHVPAGSQHRDGDRTMAIVYFFHCVSLGLFLHIFILYANGRYPIINMIMWHQYCGVWTREYHQGRKCQERQINTLLIDMGYWQIKHISKGEKHFFYFKDILWKRLSPQLLPTEVLPNR